MNTFPRSTCKSSKALRAVAMLAVIVFASGPQQAPPKTGKAKAVAPFLDDFEAGGATKPRALAPFLDDFRANTDPPLLTKEVRFPSAVGAVHGFWARPDVKERLPAVLIVYDAEPIDWMNLNTRHLASIGYEVLTVNVQRRRLAAKAGMFTDEGTLAELSAAVRWLRSRAEVLPNRLGVVGWGWSGGQALALASAMAVQACVVCDAPLPSEPGLIAGLRETPVLGVYAEKGRVSRNDLAAASFFARVHVVAGVAPGFLGPPGKKTYAHAAAEDAWVVIYHYLEKHVEDARPTVVAEPASAVATIADIMRAVNEPAGLRGSLSKALEQEPANSKQWERIRANAALVAESGGWLQMRPPPKGPVGHWREQAQAFTAAAGAIVNAADQRDYPAARRGLVLLAGQCAACHTEHR